MAIDFNIKRHDTAPPLRVVLADGNAEPLNLSDVTILKFFMRDQNATDGTNKINGAIASIEDATTGKVRYDWVVGDTNVSSLFEGEWELTKADGSVETIPNDGYLAIAIIDDLG